MDAYELERELRDPPPREVPAELRRGPFARRRRWGVLGWLFVGLAFVAMSQSPFAARWGLFCVPVEYSVWIGPGLLAVGIIKLLLGRIRGGAFEYVRRGVPLHGTITSIELRSDAVWNCYVIDVKHMPPVTNDAKESQFTSVALNSQWRANWDLSYRVGDVVTLIYLPEQPESSLRLYGLLGLRDGVGIIGPLLGPMDRFTMGVSHCALALAFITPMLFSMYSLICYRTEDIDRGQVVVLAVGAACGLIGSAAYIRHDIRSTRRRMAAGNGEQLADGRAVEVLPPLNRDQKLSLYGVMPFGGGLITAWVAWSGAIALNVWLDDSPPQPAETITVVAAESTVHAVVLGMCVVKYRRASDHPRMTHSFIIATDRVKAFNTPTASAEYRAGAFGWRWLKDIAPLPMPAPGGNAGAP